MVAAAVLAVGRGLLVQALRRPCCRYRWGVLAAFESVGAGGGLGVFRAEGVVVARRERGYGRAGG